MAEAAHIGVNLAEDAVPARSLQSLRFVEHSMPARSTVSLRARCGSSALPVLVAVAGFAVVLGAMYFITRADKVKLSRTETSVETTSRPLARETGSPSLPVRTVSERVEPDEIVLADSVESAREPVTGVEITADVSSSHSALAVREPAADEVSAYVTACLESGEYGPALDAARSLQDETVKRRTLRRIVQAQIAAGEFNAALMSIRQAVGASQPGITLAGTAAESETQNASLAGGNSGADYGQLIDLLQQETSGPWFEVDSVGGTMSEYSNGVIVEPNGVLRKLTRAETGGRLEHLGIAVREADLNDDMAVRSNLRIVSLPALEAAIGDRLAAGLPVVETMRNLAGLFEVRYVFVSPEDGEILLGGPAESWSYDEDGRPIGLESGQPLLQLDDLVTMLRTFSDSGLNRFRCSIDPRQDGMQKISEFVEKSNERGALRPRQVRGWVRTLQRLLGMQDIKVDGVPTNSRVARVIVEADYRMKLIGLGRLAGAPGIESFFELLPKNLQQDPPDMNALRWWLTMKYDAVLHSADRRAYEIQGSSVRCLSENELITSQGERVATGKAETVNRLFAEKFTEHYAELARKDTVFADLQNVFDLALVAALIRTEGLDQAANWNRGEFGPHGAYQITPYQPPTEVMSVVNHRVYNNRDIVVQVAGGVRGDVLAVVEDQDLYRVSERLGRLAQQTGRPAERWWWDVVQK